MGLQYVDIIAQMTLEEKALMMSGKNTWETVDFKKYGIPDMTMSDGPHGLRRQAGAGDHLGMHSSLPATCFPTAAGVANSWDEQLGEEIGKALADEAVTQDVNIILGPGLNIKRSPLCGRNFEYFSEDPYLSGKMAAAYVRGIGSRGISACPKHFAVNSQEERRMSMNAVVDERTLREIYITGFEIAVKEGHPQCIMTSYNEINGTYSHENAHLLKDILREEWGYKGIVISDWGGSNDHALSTQIGTHLEMPGTGKSGMQDIICGIKSGKLREDVLDERVDELLGVIFQTQAATEAAKGTAFAAEEHHRLAERAAEEAIVLLKNDDHILPLLTGTQVLIIGDFAATPRYQGAGSSMVNPAVQPKSILEELGIKKGEKLPYGLNVIGYCRGYKRNAKPKQKWLDEAVSAARDAKTVLIFAGLDENSESEGLDRKHLRLPKAQDLLIDAVSKVNENVIVVLSAGSVTELPWFEQVKAVVHGYLGGQAGASALLHVLCGDVNPSGKLNETWPLSLSDTPAFLWYPAKERNSEYREGLYVGYRYYDTVGKKVRFPFGYGLSYTTFEYSNLEITEKEIAFVIRNTGDMAGTEIAQMYVGRKSETVFRPNKELKGFARISLESGEEKRVIIPFDDKTFRFYDTGTNTWEIEQGDYDIYVGASVLDVRLMGSVFQKGTVETGPYDKKELPAYFSGSLSDVDDWQFRSLYEKELPDGSWGNEILINDPVCVLNRGKGFIGHIYRGALAGILKLAEIRGKPSLNATFQYQMPIRGFAKMTGGFITMDMAAALTEMANGHRIRGTAHLIRAAVKRKKGGGST